MCGIAGVWFPKELAEKINTAELLVKMIAGQQHRGHEAAGAITDWHGQKGEPLNHKGLGLVNDVFYPAAIERLRGDCGVAHNRYSTTGASSLDNVQPFGSVINGEGNTEWIAIAHNGNLTSRLNGLRPSTSDTWCLLFNFGATKSEPIQLRVFQALKDVKGAFSLIFLFKDREGKNSLICVRDPQGFRPLWLAKYRLESGKGKIGYLAASETCAFNKIEGARVWRPVKPGEIVIINQAGVKSFKPKAWRNQRIAQCIFELIYMMHPASQAETKDFRKNPVYVWQIQEALGGQLFRENFDLKADFTEGVPDSATLHTQGFSRRSGIPINRVILRDHSTGRTFITPAGGKKGMAETEADERDSKILRKFSLLWQKFSEASSAIICDDSIVRGKTLKRIISSIRFHTVGQAFKIIIGIMSPPIKSPCFFGIATSTKKELAWNKFGGNVEGVRKAIGADDLRYLKLDGLLTTAAHLTGEAAERWCAACFSGDYPVEIEREEYRKEIE